jgi:hypothetical protein
LDAIFSPPDAADLLVQIQNPDAFAQILDRYPQLGKTRINLRQISTAKGTAIIAGDNAAPILQFTEHVFDFVAPLVQAHMVRLLDLAATYGRDAWLHPALAQLLPKPISLFLACKYFFMSPDPSENGLRNERRVAIEVLKVFYRKRWKECLPNRLNALRCRLLSKITFGNKMRHYLQKCESLKF